MRRDAVLVLSALALAGCGLFGPAPRPLAAHVDFAKKSSDDRDVRLRVAATELRLCRLPAGDYRLGIPRQRIASDPVYLRQEQNTAASFPHGDGTLPVRLAHPLWLHKTEVTVAQWLRYCVANGLWSGHWRNQPPDAPVRDVSWHDARNYCAWLTRELRDLGFTDFVLRLPTEIEWELAARGDRDGPYPSDRRPERHGDVHAAGAVGTDESPCGALDMGANVREWTASFYHADLPRRLLLAAQSHGGTTVLPVDPRQPELSLAGAVWSPRGADGYASVRGASFRDHGNSAFLDVSWRRRGYPSRGNELTGFRFVIVLK